MFLLKLSTLSGAIFLFVSLVLSLLCVYYIRMLCRHVCFVSNNVVADECDNVVLDKTALCMDTLCIQQKCDEPVLCVQKIHVAKEIKFRSRYMMFVYHCNINNPEYHVRQPLISDIDKFILGVTKTKTLENEDLRPKTRSSFSYYENEDPRSSFSYYENEDPVKQKAVEMRSSTHIKQQQGLVI